MTGRPTLTLLIRKKPVERFSQIKLHIIEPVVFPVIVYVNTGQGVKRQRDIITSKTAIRPPDGITILEAGVIDAGLFTEALQDFRGTHLL
jgi:hypothetical protein